MTIDVWKQALRRIELKVSRHAYDSWFRDTELIADNGNVIVVGVPNTFISEWLHRHFAVIVAEALSELARIDTVIEYVPDVATSDSDHQEKTGVRPVIRNLAEVKAVPVKWRWRGRLADGKLTLIVGDPGLGKSFIALDVAARVSAARSWPDSESDEPQSNVLLLSAEDGVADTVRPRLDALGGDAARVHTLDAVRDKECERPIQLADITALELAIRATRSKVLIIDPLSAYLGRTDSHRDSEVRGLLAPLAALAERTEVAILAVMHLSKSVRNPAIYRTVGSIAFSAAPRIVLGVARDPAREIADY